MLLTKLIHQAKFQLIRKLNASMVNVTLLLNQQEKDVDIVSQMQGTLHVGNINKDIMKIIKLLILVFFITLQSCIGSKMLRYEGRYQSEMYNEFGMPNRTIYLYNGDIINCYFFEDLNPETNYKNIIGLFFVDSDKRIFKVEKIKTRLSLNQYLRTREFQ